MDFTHSLEPNHFYIDQIMLNDQRLKSSLTEFIYKADSELTTLIIQQNYHPIIVKKEIEYANKSRFLFNKNPVIVFALTYTLCEDVTNSSGDRPNDIFMDVMLGINSSGNLELTKHIGGGYDELEDIDYETYIYDKESFSNFILALDLMLDDFKKHFNHAIQMYRNLKK